jgi:hypothetical protein
MWTKLERFAAPLAAIVALVALLVSSGVCTPTWRLQTVAQAQAAEDKNTQEHDQFKKTLADINLSLGRIEGYLKGAKK